MFAQPQHQPEPPPDESSLKPARLLTGWLTAQAGMQLLAAAGPVDADAAAAKLQAARDTVAARVAHPEPAAHTQPLPAELDGHMAQFWANPAHQGFVAEGWSAKLVDLRSVTAGQDRVWLDRTWIPGLPASDLELAEITLPAATPDHQVAAQAGGNGIMLTSTTPNLRVQGPFIGPLGPGGPMVAGFMVGVAHSVVQVADLNGRLVLRDGYHRAFQLLRLGVHEVPALVRTFATSEEVLPPTTGILPTSAWLGPRPPLLADFLDDSVSLEARLPRRDQKAIVIQSAEFY